MIDIDMIIKDIEEFEKEELLNPLMNILHCKNCGDTSKNLEIKKKKVDIKKLREFQNIVNNHNKNIVLIPYNKYIFFTKFRKSDVKWEIDISMDTLIGVIEECTNCWIDQYHINYYSRMCYVTCPTCNFENTFKLRKR